MKQKDSILLIVLVAYIQAQQLANVQCDGVTDAKGEPLFKRYEDASTQTIVCFIAIKKWGFDDDGNVIIKDDIKLPEPHKLEPAKLRTLEEARFTAKEFVENSADHRNGIIYDLNYMKDDYDNVDQYVWGDGSSSVFLYSWVKRDDPNRFEEVYKKNKDAKFVVKLSRENNIEAFDLLARGNADATKFPMICSYRISLGDTTTSGATVSSRSLQTLMEISEKIWKGLTELRKQIEELKDNFDGKCNNHNGKDELLKISEDVVGSRYNMIPQNFTKSNVHYRSSKIRGECAFGWYQFEDSCFMVHRFGAKNVNWDESRNFCQQLGADLISIHSEAENDFVKGIAFSGRVGKQGPNVNAFMGLKAQAVGRRLIWKYSDGTPVDFVKWDKLRYDYTTERCGQFVHEFQEYVQWGEWNNLGCDVKVRDVICKKKAQSFLH